MANKKKALLPKDIQIDVPAHRPSASSLMGYANALPEFPSRLPDGTILDYSAVDETWKDVDFPERKTELESVQQPVEVVKFAKNLSEKSPRARGDKKFRRGTELRKWKYMKPKGGTDLATAKKQNHPELMKLWKTPKKSQDDADKFRDDADESKGV